LENLLADIWRDLLKRETIGCDDNFFELGGHSLLAARIAALVETKTGRRVPISMFFRAPTIAGLARWIEGDASPGCLVPIRPEGDQPPLFCIHGVLGDAFAFVYLARTFPPGRPIYGLQARDLDGRTPRHESIEAMAADYAREIRTHFPAGPYHLIGNSAGGWIAYAVAQELLRQGARVGLLGILDTTAHARLPHWLLVPEILASTVERVRFHIRRRDIHQARLAGLPLREQVRYLLGVLHPGKRTRFIAKRLREFGPKPHTAPPPAPPGTVAAAAGFNHDPYVALVARYRPPACPGAATVFRASSTRASRLLFWRALIRGPLTRRVVLGDHPTFLDETTSPRVGAAIHTRLTELER
jgi:thioesterase domain-containing protein